MLREGFTTPDNVKKTPVFLTFYEIWKLTNIASLPILSQNTESKAHGPPRGKPRGIFKGNINFIAASCRELNPVDFASLLK